MALLLAILFILFNLVDIAVSWLGVQSGAFEVGALYQLTGDFRSMSINKMLLAVFVGGVLVWASSRWAGAVRVLVGLNIAWLLLVAWNAYVLRFLS